MTESKPPNIMCQGIMITIKKIRQDQGLKTGGGGRGRGRVEAEER